LIAYQLEIPMDTTKKTAGKSESKKKEGTDLILKNLTTGTERVFKFVDNYKFSKNGKLLVYASTGSVKDKTIEPGVFLMDTETGTVKRLIKGKGTFTSFVFDDKNEYMAFIG